MHRYFAQLRMTVPLVRDRTRSAKMLYRFEAPRASFLTLCLLEPRGTVRFGLGAAFFLAVRFTFLRSAVSVIAFVFAIG